VGAMVVGLAVGILVVGLAVVGFMVGVMVVGLAVGVLVVGLEVVGFMVGVMVGAAKILHGFKNISVHTSAKIEMFFIFEKKSPCVLLLCSYSCPYFFPLTSFQVCYNMSAAMISLFFIYIIKYNYYI
jgi:hypothetical protein